MYNQNQGYQNNFMDILQIVSLIIGMQNLQENREQSQYNDVQLATDRQTRYIMQEIHKNFEELNAKVDKIMKALKIE